MPRSSLERKSALLPCTKRDISRRDPLSAAKSSAGRTLSRRPVAIAIVFCTSALVIISLLSRGRFELSAESTWKADILYRKPQRQDVPDVVLEDEEWEEEVADSRPGMALSQHVDPPEAQVAQPDPEEELWTLRAAEVKAEFLHAYHAYEEHAMSFDELLPITHTAVNK